MRRVEAFFGGLLLMLASSALANDAAPPPTAVSDGRPVAPIPAVPPTPPATMADFAAAIPACEATRAHCYRLRIHLGTQDRAPYVSPAWLASQFEFANRMFAPINVSFELHSVASIDAPAIVDGRKARDAIAKGIKATDAVDIFVVGALADLDDAAFPLFGVHWRTTKQTSRRFVILSSYAWGRTMAHELGHFFGLPHSTYAISIMNKTPRLEPPLEQRRFSDEEVPILEATRKKIEKRRELRNYHVPATAAPATR
jgi:hypothetical protein